MWSNYTLPRTQGDGEAGFSSLRHFVGSDSHFVVSRLVGKHCLWKILWRGKLQMFPDAKPSKWSLWVPCSRTAELVASWFLTRTGWYVYNLQGKSSHCTKLVPSSSLSSPDYHLHLTHQRGHAVSSLWWLANTVTLLCRAKYLKLQCYIQIGTNFPRRRKSTFHSSVWPKVWIYSTHSYVGSEPGP